MNKRHISSIDNFISGFDRALYTLSSATRAKNRQRPTPNNQSMDVELSPEETKHAAGLMRVNHSGEVCAQALYQGQALTAKLDTVKQDMEQAADEEIDHLAWCEDRLNALNSFTSRLNPLWYGLSFTLGAGAGLLSDKVSLGFVNATEEQVSEHLREHLRELPENDHASRVVVKTMLEDEERHAQKALDAGGYNFPKPIKSLMTLVSRAMTMASYRI